MKIGIEVEGRFKGIKTLFMSAEEYLVFNDNVEQQFNAIYISDIENVLPLQSVNLKALHEKYLITIERSWVDKVPAYLNIVLHIDIPSVWTLKPTDQIKFEKDLTVKTIPLENLYTTYPADFEQDKQI